MKAIQIKVSDASGRERRLEGTDPEVVSLRLALQIAQDQYRKLEAERDELERKIRRLQYELAVARLTARLTHGLAERSIALASDAVRKAERRSSGSVGSIADDEDAGTAGDALDLREAGPGKAKILSVTWLDRYGQKNTQEVRPAQTGEPS